MKTITTVKGQTIFDLAAQWYGNTEAFTEILDNNPDLVNDYSFANESGVTYASDELDLGHPLLAGQSVLIDTDSKLYNTGVLREMSGEDVISFDQLDKE